ncbi:MAG: chromosomal replication initiator DnaA [Fusobacteriaceae bacterium]|jgi:hypothetical protein|nr:chromosomal replication initiator DnaA [Fusobacteriaceae bacterium]
MTTEEFFEPVVPQEGKTDMTDSFDSLTILNSGSLLEDLKHVEISINEVPDIEVKEIVLRETGNFLNLEERRINIPLEMIVFPFFTYQKQNKRVNFEYVFQDLGVTMQSTLIPRSNADMVFQPSTFEEKIYTYLISMYEVKAEVDEKEDFLEFEIRDFIEKFLELKMNRTYYKKVEQALKNLYRTEYQFTIDNHTKMGKFKFEDASFRLLSYQKLSKGKKRFYRVYLNKNVRNKIKEKRYIIYKSKELVRLLEEDPIAARIYKYISQIRFADREGRINIKTLAAIIPLKIEQITKRVNKRGVEKEYVLSRVKQVLKRIEKAYDVLVRAGYILSYGSSYVKAEDTYYIEYSFNPEKDGTCHISEWIKEKNREARNLPAKAPAALPDKSSDAVADAGFRVTKIALAGATAERVLPEALKEQLRAVKTNPYIAKAWSREAEEKLQTIYETNGIKYAREVLLALKSVNSSIKKSLVQYINGVLKNKQKEAAKEDRQMSQQMRLFDDYAKVIDAGGASPEKETRAEATENARDKWESLFAGMEETDKTALLEAAVARAAGDNPAFAIDSAKVRENVVYEGMVLPYVEEMLAGKK